MSNFNVSIRPKSSILATYRDSSYKLEGSLAEFIDNSTQSYFDHTDILKSIGQMHCLVDITIENDKIIIVDNAFGMNRNDFERAIVLDSPPANTAGRSEKGMGLKTAATWLGNIWSVKTTEYGNKYGYYAELCVDEIAQNAPEEIVAEEFEAKDDEHYTIITIYSLRKKINASAINKAINLLAKMYSKDIQNNELVLKINKMPLKYERPDFWKDKDDKPYYKEFSISFSFDDKNYEAYGWAGIRKKGSTDNEGFSIFRRGRALQTFYKPKKLCGGPNSYSQQRLIGEINLDNWPVSHIKDGVQWEGGLEDKLLEEIKLEINDLMKIAEELRVTKDYESTEAQITMSKNTQTKFSGLRKVDISSVENEIKKEVISTQVVEKVSNEVPPVVVEFKNKKYTFDVIYQNNMANDWISINKTNEKDHYKLLLNIDLDYFESYKEDRKKVEFLQKIACTIATTLVFSSENGSGDFYNILKILNTIVRHTK